MSGYCDTPGCVIDERRLYARTGRRSYCAVCYVAAGRPPSWEGGPVATAQEVHERELATRERMTARGGTDRHLVRNGRT